MKLTKERARSPILESGSFNAKWGYGEYPEREYTITCHSPWVQGKGHAASYTLHLTKSEMLFAMATWMAALKDEDRESRSKEQQGDKT